MRDSSARNAPRNDKHFGLFAICSTCPTQNYSEMELAPFAGGVRAGFVPLTTSFTIWAVISPLTGQPVSFTRHCESVSVHPQVQPSVFIRRRARFFWSAVKPLKLTPG